MKSALAPILVFFASLALNWNIKTEYPEKNGVSGVDIFYANALLAVGLILTTFIFLRMSFRAVRQMLIEAGILHKDEQLVSWRYALLAPLPCLVMFRYSWMTEDGKRFLEYGGSTNSTLAYFVGVTALIAFQLHKRLSSSKK